MIFIFFQFHWNTKCNIFITIFVELYIFIRFLIFEDSIESEKMLKLIISAIISFTTIFTYLGMKELNL